MLYRFDSVSKSYGVQDVLQGATWQHNPGEHAGLVGRNGAGKTTLFRLLLKQEDPDSGSIIRASGLTMGHVSQHLDADPGIPLFDFVLSAFHEVLRIESKMRELEHRLAEEPSSGEAHDRLLGTYAELQHEYEHLDGYTIHSEVERVLSGVGFDETEWQRPIGQFSGGQQNRAMLARVLLTKVDLLLLDEPTNHLDLKGIEFLEEFLQTFRGSYLLISHDRTFLNRTVQKIIELAHGKLVEYHGNYDRFLVQRSERLERLVVEYERQQEHIDKTEDFIRRNIAGQKTKQAQSRRKMLAKLDEVERPLHDETLARFELDAGPRSGAIALTAERLTAGYDKPVVSGLSLTVRRGERYAIMGPNGSGKSTLLKTFAGRLPPLAGDITWGHNVQTGYYDQTLGDLSPEGIVIDEVWNLDHSQSEEEVRNYLARFSFFGEDVFKKIRALSGGEKGRLALAKIMYAGGNLLLLDEPTNHLDVYTREALEAALERFTGALIVVSHDRYFIDRIAEQILLVEDGEAEVHHGNYSRLVQKFKEEAAIVSARRSLTPAPLPPKEVDRNEAKRREKLLRRIEEEIASIEKEIASLESEREKNDALLCSEEVYRDGDRTRALQSSNALLAQRLVELYRRWEEQGRERDALAGERREGVG
ncbi:MAG TPA: ABC-F family ATP-binding cassette domain-containing protein [Thermoanaerobaculia bacterium]|nr:ABC-F family ATP-binding cassette domain-containing protein [Thermoanaerobaculia bacterium]